MDETDLWLLLIIHRVTVNQKLTKLFRSFKLKYMGLYFGPKAIFITPPPSENDIFPVSQNIVFRLPSWPLCHNSSLFCIYFTILLWATKKVTFLKKKSRSE
jgi:hypothetical protein